MPLRSDVLDVARHVLHGRAGLEVRPEEHGRHISGVLDVAVRQELLAVRPVVRIRRLLLARESAGDAASAAFLHVLQGDRLALHEGELAESYVLTGGQQSTG